MITFGKWLPDLAPTVDCLEVCKNLLPYYNRLYPLPDLTPYSSNTLSGTPLVMFKILTVDGTPHVFAASTTRIYKLINGVLTDRSKSGGYSTGTSDTWSHTIYGNMLIATNNADPIQKLTDIFSGTFADLGGTPPLAKFVCMFKDHLFLGGTTESGTFYSRRVFRSKQGDPENWAVDSATGCGFYDLPSWGENITGMVVNGDYLFVYMNNSIWMISFIGPPLWFAYNKIYDGTSALGQGCIANIGNSINIVLTPSDVLKVSGGIVSSLGVGIRSVLKDINQAFPNRITNVVDKERRLIIWAYPTTGSTDGMPDRLLIYNYEEDRFTSANLSLYCVGDLTVGGTTLDGLDTMFPTFDSVKLSFDSNLWSLNTPSIGGIDQFKYVSTFSGTPLVGRIVTSETELDSVGMLTQVRPNIDVGGESGSMVTLTVSSRMDQSSSLVEHPYVTMNSKGLCNLRVTGRFFKARFDIAGNHSGFYGYTPTIVQRGRR